MLVTRGLGGTWPGIASAGMGSSDATPTPPTPPTQGFVGFVPHRRQLKPAIDKLNERRKKKKDKRNIALLLLMSDF